MGAKKKKKKGKMEVNEAFVAEYQKNICLRHVKARAYEDHSSSKNALRIMVGSFEIITANFSIGKIDPFSILFSNIVFYKIIYILYIIYIIYIYIYIQKFLNSFLSLSHSSDSKVK